VSDKPKAKLLDLRIVELSGVDRPCHAPATVALMKRAQVGISVENDPREIIPAMAAHTKSTRSGAVQHGSDMKLIVLTEAQHAHYSKLATADAEAFIAKSSAERDAVLAEIAKADEVVFKGELTGLEVRKSQGEFALKVAKAAEASEKRAQDADKAAQIEKAAREATELRKRATETMPNLAGSDDAHCAILKAVESIADEKLRGEAITALKAANAAAKAGEVAKGFGGTDPQPDGPEAALKSELAK
jgi:hypothetical protein